MGIEFKEVSRWLGRQLLKRIWTTPEQKRITTFSCVGLALGCVAIPPFGIAVFGTAFAGWWLAVFTLAVFGALFGHHLNIRIDRNGLKRELDRDKSE